MIYNKQILINMFIDGDEPTQLFGTSRRKAAQEIASILADIKPDEDDRIKAAFGYGPVLRKVLAYDKGKRWFERAYYDVADMFDY